MTLGTMHISVQLALTSEQSCFVRLDLDLWLE